MSKIPIEVGQVVTLEVERLTFGGAGLGRYQGFVVFVPYTCPGDSVEVEITEIKKNFATGRISKILKPSELRTIPQCPVFGECGGCEWQHVSYEQQLKEKEQIVRMAVSKAKLKADVLLPIIASPSPWRYRNRIQLHKAPHGYGFRKRQSHDVVPIMDCPITEEAVAEKITLPHKAERMDIRRTLNGSISVTNASNDDVTALGFSQVNSAQNENMIATLLDWTRDQKIDVLLDLYAGSGNLTSPLYSQLQPKSAIAIELNPQAVVEGRRQNRNIEFMEASVDNYIKTVMTLPANTLVVLDPPRMGCASIVMETLAKLKPLQILYVSCDPMTWARDVSRLLELAPYKLTRVQPLDMFPQTSHVEVISHLIL